MLQLLRGATGAPAVRTRAVAALLVVGMVAATAPVVIPVAKWMVRTVSDVVVGYDAQD
jgi:hypothetical protein